ncbi:MAG: flagellar basal body rod protein FlgC [Parvibaculaceae bacterium]
MADPLQVSLKVAASGLDAQSTRMRVIAENLANLHTTSKVPGGDPYARKTVSFANVLDRAEDASMVKVDSIGVDRAPFDVEFNPGHPAADANGYVKLPNVNMAVEMADMRETNRSYEANLQIIKRTRELLSMTIDLLRNQS